MHALCGITSSTVVFTLKLKFGKSTAIALIDSGSDISFVNAKFATRHKFQISATSPLKGAAANGSTMTSETICSDCHYSIQGHEFISHFRVLELQGYDIILGADWIYDHSPVGLNLKTTELTITKNGTQHITFQDESLPPNHLIIGPRKLCHLLRKKACSSIIVLSTTSKPIAPKILPTLPPEISTVLEDYADVFQEPTELPPNREVITNMAPLCHFE